MLLAGSKERRHGRAVIVSSITSDIIVPGMALYVLSDASAYVTASELRVDDGQSLVG
jgi:hypothetical protein